MRAKLVISMVAFVGGSWMGGGDLLAAVHVARPGGPTIQDAVDAAVDGDTVLVKEGTYFHFSVNGKSLTIVAEKGEDVSVIDSGLPFGTATSVSNIDAGQVVTIRRIHTNYVVVNCLGSVRFEQCTMKGTTGACDLKFSVGPDGETGLRVINSNHVAALGCSIYASAGGYGVGPFITCCTAGGAAIHATNSTVVVYQGVVKPTSSLTQPCASAPAFLGDTIILHNTTVIGPRDLSGESPLRRGETGALHVESSAGDYVLLFTSISPAFTAVAPYPGTLLGLPFLGTFPLGVLPSTSQDIPVAFPDIPTPGVAAVDLQIQAAFLPTSGLPVIGPMTVITLLEPSL